jgi:hypothetical protein
MKECPELRDIAHFVETGEGSPDMVAHLDRCDACQEARENFEDEAMSLQISISELWFREQISCPDGASLERFRAKALGPEERAYVEFHLETLECGTCQARLGEAEVAHSEKARGSASRSRKKVADATVKLLGDLRKGKGR